MATTVRKGVFETNSSSTHSISIEEITTNDDQILKDGVLDLEAFWSNSIESSNYVYASSFIVCDTFEKKLALAFCLINEESYQYEMLMNMFNIKEVRNHEEYYIGDEDNDFDRVFKAIKKDNLKITRFYEYN